MMAKKDIQSTYDPWTVLQHPSMTEKSIRFIESENKLVFIVNRTASKPDIKRAIETAFNVKVDQIQTLLATDNHKKAYIKLVKGSNASDVATRLGII